MADAHLIRQSIESALHHLTTPNHAEGHLLACGILNDVLAQLGKHPDAGEPVPETSRGWLHRCDQIKSEAFASGFERGLMRERKNAAAATNGRGALSGWVSAADAELVSAHLGVASEADDFDTARKKLSTLIEWSIDVATDPAVNGGFALKAVEPLDPVDGDQLPPIGSRVWIRHGRDDRAHACRVLGYYAWGDLGGNADLHRVFVRVTYEGRGGHNARLLRECFRTQEEALSYQWGKVSGVHSPLQDREPNGSFAKPEPESESDLRAEISRLSECLKKANEQAEHFEREWYLRGHMLEDIKKIEPDAGAYSLKRIGWELERTALGDGYYGNALRVAMEVPGVTERDKAVLQRYATGSQSGTDHVALQDLASKLYFFSEDQ